MKKNKKYIILILLVIAIVILLILAGITIKNVTEKSGLLSKVLNEQEQEIQGQEEHSIETIYVVNSTSGNNIYLTITIESDDEIEQVQTPDENTINANRKKLAIDYTVVSGIDYTFKIKRKSDTEAEEYILKADINAKPVISQNQSSIYPILTPNGVELNKQVTIEYEGEETNNLYSLDNGATWNSYTETIKVKNSGKVLAKTIKDHEITKMTSQNITLNLAADALGPAAYDGNDGTRFNNSYRDRILKISPDMIGKQVRVYCDSNTGEGGEFYICNSSGATLLYRYQYRVKVHIVTIPANADYFRFWYSDYVYEVGPYNG